LRYAHALSPFEPLEKCYNSLRNEVKVSQIEGEGIPVSNAAAEEEICMETAEVVTGIQ